MKSGAANQSPVGVIGLGLLGAALCERLLDAGREVHCYNRTREKAQPLLDRGAKWADNPVAVCREVVVCLYTSDVVWDCLSSFRSGLRAGQVVVDATTGGPEDAQRLGGWLAESGVDYLESPIAASSEQTRQGKGTSFVGGSREVFHANHQLLKTLAPNTHYVGPWGAAAKFKLVNNLILGLNRVALAEGLALADRLGLAPDQTLGVLKQCNAYSGVMDTKGQKMVSGDFSTQAKLSQHAKDVRIILEQAAQAGLKLPLSQTHLALLEKAEAMGLGEQDNSIVIRAIDERTH